MIMISAINNYIDKTSLEGNIVFLCFTLPIFIFSIFVLYGYDVANSLIAVSTFSMALTAMFTVLFSFAKEKKRGIKDEQ